LTDDESSKIIGVGLSDQYSDETRAVAELRATQAGLQANFHQMMIYTFFN